MYDIQTCSTTLMVARLSLNLHPSVEFILSSLRNLYFIKSCGYCPVGDSIFKRVDQADFTYIGAWLLWLRIGYIILQNKLANSESWFDPGFETDGCYVTMKELSTVNDLKIRLASSSQGLNKWNLINN